VQDVKHKYGETPAYRHRPTLPLGLQYGYLGCVIECPEERDAINYVKFLVATNRRTCKEIAELTNKVFGPIRSKPWTAGTVRKILGRQVVEWVIAHKCKAN
jgi:hypothetical protein